MPRMQVYQTGVSTTAEADLHALHNSLPQGVAKSTQQLALQIRQLRRPAGLGDADDEHPAREAERAGVGRQLRSHEVGPVPEQVAERAPDQDQRSQLPKNKEGSAVSRRALKVGLTFMLP